MEPTTNGGAAEAKFHFALLPCAGTGHLLPFLRLAAMLNSHGAAVTLIVPQPTVSYAESHLLNHFFSSYPAIHRLDFHLLPYTKSSFKNEDPFFIQFESIYNSVPLLSSQLRSSSLPSPITAIVSDFAVTGAVSELASTLAIPVYTLAVTSATFFNLMSKLPRIIQEKVNGQQRSDSVFQLTQFTQIPVSKIPPPMLDPHHFFSSNIIANVLSLHKSKGVFLNTFASLEPEALEDLKSNLPSPILPIGPLPCFGSDADTVNVLPWLDDQPPESVLFVGFGNRTSLPVDQVLELASGLEQSGCNFLWLFKGNIVDKEDKEEIENILGASFLERTKNKGMVIKGWVDQGRILGHRAIGAFLSHCGWNSVVEAVRSGVPVLAWPQLGDQMVNEEAVEKGGFGIMGEDWGWCQNKVVHGGAIAAMIVKLMADEGVRSRAKSLKEEALAHASHINIMRMLE